jgi:hypothetical protein
MGFSSIQKTASTGSSTTGALVGANSLQPDLCAALGGGRRLGFHTSEEPSAWFQRVANTLLDATGFENIFVFLSSPFLIQHINGKSGGQ